MLSFTSWLRSLWVRFSAISNKASVDEANTAVARIEVPVTPVAHVEISEVVQASAEPSLMVAKVNTAVSPTAPQLALRIAGAKRINRVKRRTNRRGDVRTVGRTAKTSLKKRAPDLYPMKRRKPVAHKPALKVLVHRPKSSPKVRPSAIIIQLPIAARSNAVKQKSNKAA